MKKDKFSQNRLSAIDLFSGAGGLSLGLERAGFSVLASNEIMPDFCETYRLNHPDTLVIQDDIHKISFVELKKHALGKSQLHLIAGGPPCQGFSTVGKKDEFDPRNTLFQEFLRAIKETDPLFVLFENVSGFRKLYSGRIFDSLIESLDNLGYAFKYAQLNALDFGLPQFRERTIIVGFRKEFAFAMPIGHYGKQSGLFGALPYRTLSDAVGDLPFIESGQISHEYARPPMNDYQQELRDGMTSLTEHFAPKHGEHMLEVIRCVPDGGSILDVPQRLRPKGYFNNTYARLKWDMPTPTMTRNFGTPSSSRCIHPHCDRGLTTREGARLQGFPDSYRFFGGKGSKNLQIGNAVPPVFGYEIGMAIREALTRKAYLVQTENRCETLRRSLP